MMKFGHVTDHKVISVFSYLRYDFLWLFISPMQLFLTRGFFYIISREISRYRSWQRHEPTINISTIESNSIISRFGLETRITTRVIDIITYKTKKGRSVKDPWVIVFDVPTPCREHRDSHFKLKKTFTFTGHNCRGSPVQASLTLYPCIFITQSDKGGTRVHVDPQSLWLKSSPVFHNLDSRSFAHTYTHTYTHTHTKTKLK